MNKIDMLLILLYQKILFKFFNRSSVLCATNSSVKLHWNVGGDFKLVSILCRFQFVLTLYLRQLRVEVISFGQC